MGPGMIKGPKAINAYFQGNLYRQCPTSSGWLLQSRQRAPEVPVYIQRIGVLGETLLTFPFRTVLMSSLISSEVAQITINLPVLLLVQGRGFDSE